MIRIGDQIIIDWGIFVWEQDGEMVEQIQACLFNGIVLIMNLEDFFIISDDDA